MPSEKLLILLKKIQEAFKMNNKINGDLKIVISGWVDEAVEEVENGGSN